MHTISVAADGRFILECPLANGQRKRIIIQANEKGMILMRRIILADVGASRIGEPAAPVQYDIDKLLAAWNDLSGIEL